MTHTDPIPAAAASDTAIPYETADPATAVSHHPFGNNSIQMHMHPTYSQPGDQLDWSDGDTSFESAQDSSSAGQYTAMATAQLAQGGQHGQQEQQGQHGQYGQQGQRAQPVQQPTQLDGQQPWQRPQLLQQAQVQQEHGDDNGHVSGHVGAVGAGEGAPSSSCAHARSHSSLVQSAQSLKQQLSILHPALSAASSSNAPAIYALTSSVPYPTINQLSMSLPHDPIAPDTLAMPFKTAVAPSATVAGAHMAHTGSPTDSFSASGPSFSSPTSLTSPSLTSPIRSLPHTHNHPSSAAASATASASISASHTAPPTQSTATTTTAAPFVPFAPADGRGVLEGSDMSMNDHTQGDIHPYFAGTNFSTVPNSPQDKRVGPSSPVRTRPNANYNGSSLPSSGLTSPTHYFTPMSTATSMSPPHPIARAAGSLDDEETVGSRSEMFGFASAYNQGDLQQLNTHAAKERVRPSSTEFSEPSQFGAAAARTVVIVVVVVVDHGSDSNNHDG
ncbi:hypothetical protein BGZ72_010507 [Mortierella alpina]|nr:hypothetical protein BGZ72_010507 [Mortierella alpina]